MKTQVTQICQNCAHLFSISLSDKNRGRGRFCGKRCAATGPNNSSFRHGHALGRVQSKEYRAWADIKKRTLNPHATNYPYYGARGIRVCKRWLDSFETFLSDMGLAPSSAHTIDRIDVNGDYQPNNCRWATKYQQMSNMRSNKYLTYGGLTLTQEEWGRRTGLGGLTILKRLKRGWSVEKTLTTAKRVVLFQ